MNIDKMDKDMDLMDIAIYMRRIWTQWIQIQFELMIYKGRESKTQKKNTTRYMLSKQYLKYKRVAFVLYLLLDL